MAFNFNGKVKAGGSLYDKYKNSDPALVARILAAEKAIHIPYGDEQIVEEMPNTAESIGHESFCYLDSIASNIPC